MKYLTFSVYFSLFILCSSCSPIFIKYVIISNDINLEREIKSSTNPILFECQITQGHYPNKKVQNFIKITIHNFSNDTILFGENDFIKLSTKVNVIDTNQLKKLFFRAFKNDLVPQTEFSLNEEYWSNSFQGSFKKLIKILKKEQIEIQIIYKNKGRLFKKFILLRPDLGRFKKL